MSPVVGVRSMSSSKMPVLGRVSVRVAAMGPVSPVSAVTSALPVSSAPFPSLVRTKLNGKVTVSVLPVLTFAFVSNTVTITVTGSAGVGIGIVLLSVSMLASGLPIVTVTLSSSVGSSRKSSYVNSISSPSSRVRPGKASISPKSMSSASNMPVLMPVSMNVASNAATGGIALPVKAGSVECANWVFTARMLKNATLSPLMTNRPAAALYVSTVNGSVFRSESFTLAVMMSFIPAVARSMLIVPGVVFISVIRVNVILLWEAGSVYVTLMSSLAMTAGVSVIMPSTVLYEFVLPTSIAIMSSS